METEKIEKKEVKNEKKELVKTWLNKEMKILVSDGRIFIGKFICLDHWKNTMMTETKQYTKIENSDGNLDKIIFRA